MTIIIWPSDIHHPTIDTEKGDPLQTISKKPTKGRDELPPLLRWLLPQHTHVKIQLREQMSLAALWDQYIRRSGMLGFMATWVSIWPLLVGIWLVVPDSSSYNNAADARVRIVQSLAMSDLPANQQVAERKIFAGDMLNVYLRGINSDIETGGDTGPHTAAILSELRAAQQTGRPIKLDTAHQTWRDHLPGIAERLALLLYCCLMLRVTLLYTVATMQRVEYLADLPWHHVWPLAVVVLSPALIPSYIISAVRLAYVKRFIADETASEEGVSTDFEVDEDAARQLYFDLRFGDWRDRVRDRKEAIEERIAEIIAITRANHRERSELQAERRNLDEFDIQTSSPDSETVHDEFETLLADPWIHGLNVDDEELVAFTRSRFLYQGVVYDLGDWAVRVSTRGIKAIELRSGVKVAWHMMHPIYRNGDGSFCFGMTTEVVNELLAKGELSRAVIIAVEAIHSVNPEDQFLIPDAFKVATDASTHPAQLLSTEGPHDPPATVRA